MTGSAGQIDLNADLGEVPGDLALVPLVTSANVACGGHAGDPSSMGAAVAAALRSGVVLGAHPSYPDREGFGRRELARDERQVFEDCVYQIGALAGLAKAVGLAAGIVTQMMPLLNDWDFDALITHNRFTLANRNADAMLNLARARGIAVLNAAPYASSVLAKG